MLCLQAIQPLLQQHLAQHPQPQLQQQEHSFLSEKLTVLLLLQEPAAWGPAELWVDPQQHQAWIHLLDASAVSILDGEVGYLRQQLHHIEDVLQVSGNTSSSCNSCSSSEPAQGTVAAAGAAGMLTAVEAVGDAAGFSSPCSTCIFQHDCSLKGCLNVHGEVEVLGATAPGRLQQPKQQQQARPAAEISSSGCCSSGHGAEEGLFEHGCCS